MAAIEVAAATSSVMATAVVTMVMAVAVVAVTARAVLAEAGAMTAMSYDDDTMDTTTMAVALEAKSTAMAAVVGDDSHEL